MPSSACPIHPPPRSTLFPYTTLFRSDQQLRGDFLVRESFHDQPQHFELALAQLRAAHPLGEPRRRRRGQRVLPRMHLPNRAEEIRPEDRKSTRLNSSH